MVHCRAWEVTLARHIQPVAIAVMLPSLATPVWAGYETQDAREGFLNPRTWVKEGPSVTLSALCGAMLKNVTL